jgi:ferric-dicitrate binding protein FerR (iron transport regulator)
VLSRSQVTEDIGTRFNVKAYDDEPVVQTTLLEGSVSVADDKNKIVLKPGQQSQVKASGLDIVVKMPTWTRLCHGKTIVSFSMMMTLRA